MLKGIFSFLISFAAVFAVLAILLRFFAKAAADAEEELIEEADDLCEETECAKCAAPDADGCGCYRLILNTNSKILHTDENCRALRHIQEENRSILEKADPDTLVALGYTVCGICASELRK